MKKIVDKILNTCLIITLSIMSLTVATNVFFRFVLDASIYWGDELALVLFVWLTFLGAAVSIREREHYAFNYISGKLKSKALRQYLLLRDCINIIIILALLYFSTMVTVQINAWIMPAMEISRALVYGAAPVGCLFMLYYMVLRIWHNEHRRFTI